MKAAAAVLGASLLFFVGVLTGAGRREAIPPPAAIPLGVGTPASPAEGPTSPPSTSRATTPTAPGAGSNPSTAATATTTRADATAPPASADPIAPPGTTSSTGGAAGDTTAPSTPTTGGPGQVEEVDNEVDCRSAGKPGKGKREPCPSTMTSTAEAPGGGGNR